LVAKYISNIYCKEIGPTIGASFFTCKINLNNTKVKMQLWDTAGQERFKAMAPMYYRNANAALLVFDVTQHTSFEEVKSWILELQKNVLEPMFLLLVGNKIDLEEQRAVSREEAFLYSQSIGAKYLETSAVKDQVRITGRLQKDAKGFLRNISLVGRESSKSSSPSAWDS